MDSCPLSNLQSGVLYRRSMFLLSNIVQKLIIQLLLHFRKSFAVKMSSAVLTEKFGKSYILKQKRQKQFILFKNV